MIKIVKIKTFNKDNKPKKTKPSSAGSSSFSFESGTKLKAKSEIKSEVKLKANSQAGFTLIELIIVAVIIGILTAIALPAYHDYISRSQLSESFTISSTAREAVSHYYKYTGEFPIDNYASGLSDAESLTGKYVKSLTVDHGAIHVQFLDNSPKLAGKIVTMRPVHTVGEPTAPIHFICGYANPVSDLQKAVGENKTNVDENLLPSSCKDNSQ